MKGSALKVGTLFTSAVIAAIVSALVAVSTSERRIAAENVIQERKKWRDQIREVALEVQTARALGDTGKLEELRARLFLLLNPHEIMDQEILESIALDDTSGVEFRRRVALLLKHDWERAKREASFSRCLLERPPVRVRFEEFQPGVEHDYRVWRPLTGLVVRTSARLRGLMS